MAPSMPVMPPNSTSAEAWDAAASGWNSNASLIRTWLADATPAMLDAAAIGSGMRVLDLAAGAGAGDQTWDIAHRVGPHGGVVATDISPQMAALAQANLAAAGIAWAEVRVADAEAAGPHDAIYDAAVCRLGLMFCTDPLAALRATRRALVPGGRFAALVFSDLAANPCIAIMTRTARRHAGLPMAAPMPGSLLSLGRPGLMAELLAAAGFVGIGVRPVGAPFRLPSCGDYLAFVRSSGSPIMDLLRNLPADAQEAAWSDMADQLAGFSSDDGWVGPNELLLCWGRCA